jgi:hypothetical protein
LLAVLLVSAVVRHPLCKQHDAQIAAGSDLRITPLTDPPSQLPDLRSSVAAITPVRTIPARAGSDRKTIMALDPATYGPAITPEPVITDGAGVADLIGDPNGVLPNAGTSAADAAVVLQQQLPAPAFTVITAQDRVRASQRSLTAGNLAGLSTIESAFAALIAALGVAVLGPSWSWSVSASSPSWRRSAPAIKTCWWVSPCKVRRQSWEVWSSVSPSDWRSLSSP